MVLKKKIKTIRESIVKSVRVKCPSVLADFLAIGYRLRPNVDDGGLFISRERAGGMTKWILRRRGCCM